MIFKNPYWSNKLRMGSLQRWLIVHSILYYEMSSSIVEDRVFDANAKQLVEMQAEFPDEAEESEYWYVFYDFDGSTGFDLFHRLNKHDKHYLTQIAQHVLAVYKAGGSTSYEKAKRNSKDGRRS